MLYDFIYLFFSKYTWQSGIHVYNWKNKFEVKNLDTFDKLLFMFNYVGNFIFIWTLYIYEQFFLHLYYKTNVAEEKMIQPQTKPHRTVLRGLVWAKVRCGLGWKNVKSYICGLGWVTSQTAPTQTANTPS